MQDKAYHLQAMAHRAVRQSLLTGRLSRGPCEVCGREAQAHHDSYFPERWLDVRWLCSRHHREWHDHNEPEWPTIYGYHPSDSLGAGGNSLCSRHPDGGSGRPPSPWYWSSRQAWYVNFRGKRYRLSDDREVAENRFRELLNGRVWQR